MTEGAVRDPCFKCDGRGWFTGYDQKLQRYAKVECDHRYTDEEMQEAMRGV